MTDSPKPESAPRAKTVKWSEEPELGWAGAMYIPAVLSGVATAVRHALTTKPVTRQYPEVEPEIPQNYRGVHRLNRDEEGRVKCVACYMCQTVCPAKCIEIEAAPAPKDDPHWKDRDKYPASFVLDELRCIYCGMCEEACPVDAIELTSVYDLTGMSREELLFDKEKLLSVYDKTKDSGKDPIRTNRGKLGPAAVEAPTAKQGPPPPGRGRPG